jgi:hypothetical protein
MTAGIATKGAWACYKGLAAFLPAVEVDSLPASVGGCSRWWPASLKRATGLATKGGRCYQPPRQSLPASGPGCCQRRPSSLQKDIGLATKGGRACCNGAGGVAAKGSPWLLREAAAMRRGMDGDATTPVLPTTATMVRAAEGRATSPCWRCCERWQRWFYERRRRRYCKRRRRRYCKRRQSRRTSVLFSLVAASGLVVETTTYSFFSLRSLWIVGSTHVVELSPVHVLYRTDAVAKLT